MSPTEPDPTLFPAEYVRAVTFLDVSGTGRYPMCVPSRVLLDGDDVTGHLLPGRLVTPVRQTGRRRIIQPWAIDSSLPGGVGAVVVRLLVRPESVTVTDRQVTFAGHNMLAPAFPYAVEDLGEVELVPGHVSVRTLAEPWREKAVLLRFFADRVEFRSGPVSG